MEELRPDVTYGKVDGVNQPQGDKRVRAPGETLDDRDKRQADFEVDEEFSSTNTNYGGEDPAT